MSLWEGPLGWFTGLPANFVTNFKVLETKFTTQYDTSRPHRTSSMSLLNVKQEKGESLRIFMDRFSKVCMGIWNLNPEIAMHHLVSAILPGRFIERKTTTTRYGWIEDKSYQVHADRRTHWLSQEDAGQSLWKRKGEKQRHSSPHHGDRPISVELRSLFP